MTDDKLFNKSIHHQSHCKVKNMNGFDEQNLIRKNKFEYSNKTVSFSP